MRAALAKILSSVARIVFLPVEIVVNGVRHVIQMLVPARNTESLDVAEDVVGEEVPAEQLQMMAAAREARKAAAEVRRSEPMRIRMAARELSEGRSVSKALFDPAVPDEAEVLDWMRDLGAFHLGLLMNATDEEIEWHLRGDRYRSIPLLPADEARAEELREANRMPDEIEWIRILIDRRKSNGDYPDGDQMDDLIAEARQLVESRARVGDHLPRRVSGGSRYDEAA
ncbi:hypothetical protein GCM10011390_18860 [Aureimonas endophytica]|uniref:Uncharacterized protein n=1 Tax=Aureimonas endophytica TaxID=2027858 RepID=A0A917E4K8_9HYPH|nr:hypothetical protein [Aureimonas endophytica]GGE00268.1 hypothetical protein GCM10011390_18860 [Aureimonas endophytica]